MTNAHDARIASLFIGLDHHRRLPDARLLDLLPQIKDDSNYWQMVATTWIKWGRTSELETWRALFSADRRGRWHLMKKKDRKIWRGLPNTVVAFRGIAPGEDVPKSISFTLDPTVIERIYGDSRTVARLQCKKEDIVAYFDRRGEREIIVL